MVWKDRPFPQKSESELPSFSVMNDKSLHHYNTMIKAMPVLYKMYEIFSVFCSRQDIHTISSFTNRVEVLY